MGVFQKIGAAGSSTDNWAAATLLSLAVGGGVGIMLQGIWFLLGVFVLNHGDSAPDWSNAVSDALLVASLAVSVVAGQCLFFLRKGRRHDSSTSGA